MSNSGREPFNRRAFVSTMMVLSGLCLPVTGLANHLLQMEGMTVSRHAWMAAHNSFGLMFVGFALWHAVMNRRALANYARSMGASLPRMRREMVCAALIVAVTMFVFVGHAFHAH